MAKLLWGEGPSSFKNEEAVLKWEETGSAWALARSLQKMVVSEGIDEILFSPFSAKAVEALKAVTLLDGARPSLSFYFSELSGLLSLIAAEELLLGQEVRFCTYDPELARLMNLFGADPGAIESPPLNLSFSPERRERLRKKYGLGPSARVFVHAAPMLVDSGAQHLSSLFVDFWRKSRSHSYLFLLGQHQDWAREYANYETLPGKFFYQLQAQVDRSFIEVSGGQDRLRLWGEYSEEDFIDLLHLGDVYVSASLPPFSPHRELRQAQALMPCLCLGPREREMLGKNLAPEQKIFDLNWVWNEERQAALQSVPNEQALAQASLEFLPRKNSFFRELETKEKVCPQKFTGFKSSGKEWAQKWQRFPHFFFQEKRRKIVPNDLWREVFGGAQ